MTTTTKRPRAKSSARKTVAGKRAGKASALKPAATKSLATKSSAKHASAAAKKTAKTRRITTTVGKPAASGVQKKSPVARKRVTKAAAVRPAPRNLSPETKKNIAVRHLWELVEEKKRRAAQPPAWQNIGHRDHGVPGSRTVETTAPNAEPARFHVGGHQDKSGD